nr:Rv3235 family protein [Micrococcus luteus]
MALARGAGQVDPSHGAAGRRRAAGPGRRPAPAVPPRAPASAPRPVGARVCEVAPGRVEASATVLWEGRARAFALRLERRLSRWKVTSVEIG